VTRQPAGRLELARPGLALGVVAAVVAMAHLHANGLLAAAQPPAERDEHHAGEDP
jgi:hypothetical protein